MQLPIPGLELLLLEEERVVEQGEGVEDVEVVALGEDEGVVDESLEAGGQGGLAGGGLEGREGRRRGIVVEVCGADGGAGGGFEDGGLGRGEGEMLAWWSGGRWV